MNICNNTSFTHTHGLRFLVGVFLVGASVALFSYSALTLEQKKYLDPTLSTINVTGLGEVLATPDIGQFSFSVRAEAETAAAAQSQASAATDAVIAFLQESAIAETDIKTVSYNLWPQYQWVNNLICPAGVDFCPEGERVQTGFVVEQSVSVKVRDLDMTAVVLAGVAEQGATNISGLSFVVDDIETLYVEAQALAIADAQTQAEELADKLGVRLGRVVGYQAVDQAYPEPYFARSNLEAAVEESVAKPILPTGQNITNARVTVTYKIY